MPIAVSASADARIASRIAGSRSPVLKSSLALASAARASAVSRGASVAAPRDSAVCSLASAAAMASRARSDLLAADAGVAMASVMALETRSEARMVLRNIVFSCRWQRLSPLRLTIPLALGGNGCRQDMVHPVIAGTAPHHQRLAAITLVESGRSRGPCLGAGERMSGWDAGPDDRLARRFDKPSRRPIV